MNTKNESKWVWLVRERYEPAADVEMAYEDECNLLWLLNAPEQYEIEPQMLKYAEGHPEATMGDLVDYFREIVPPGLPPCASEWENDEDDE